MSDDSGTTPTPIEASTPGNPPHFDDSRLSATVVSPQGSAEEPANDLDLSGDGVLTGGTLLKHFRIVRLIGRGGMGDVYEAHDESLERTVAIKVIRAGRHIAPADHARLIHEARAQARINDSRVVQIYYVGLEPECPFLAMELVRGTTLSERIRRGRLPFREIVRLALEIVEGLRRAAQMQIVHSDIKPGNILLDEGGSAKLSDFGLAQRNATDEDRSTGLTGTPKYMAPELVAGERNSVASDMYALGITLYELTLGLYPYSRTATTVKEQFEQHRSAAVDFPQPWPSDLPEVWRDVLARLLAKDPAGRYADYDRLHDEITRFRPTTRLPVAFVPRGQAWLIDLVLLAILFGLIGGMGRWIPALFHSGPDAGAPGGLVHFIVNVFQAIAFGLLAWAFGRFGVTPGKWLFQISITDPHGLPASPIRLIPRFVLAQFPIALEILLDFFVRPSSQGGEWLTVTQVVLTGGLLIANVVSIAIDKRRLALHDRLLRTCAVVDHAR